MRSLKGPDSIMGGCVIKYSSKSTGSTASVRGICREKSKEEKENVRTVAAIRQERQDHTEGVGVYTL